MAFQTLVVTPTGDIFTDLYNKFNNNANQSIDSVTLLVNVLTFTRAGGGTIAVNLPIAGNRIISGIVASSVAFTLSTTAGSYQVNNVAYSVGAGLFAILPAHATLNRIDVLVGTSLGTLVYTAGVPATNPIPPFVASDEVLITTINVPAASIPNLNQNGFYTLPQGTVNGQTIRWDLANQEWIIADSIRTTDNSTLITATSFYALNCGVAPNNSYHNLTPNSNQIGVQLGLTTFHEMLIDSTGINLIANGTSAGALNIDAKEGIYINSNVPSSTTDKLYNDSGFLYWNGLLLCTAPCGGGGGNVDDGTLEFSTLRWDNTALQWIENKQNLANGSKWNQTCCGVVAPSFGVANIATGLLFSQGGGITINSRASIVIASGQNSVINHIPSSSSDGMNSIISSHTSDMDLHPDYKGLCTIIGSNLISISSPSLPVTTDGQAFSISSYNSFLSQEITRTGVIGSDDINTFNTLNSGALFSSAVILGTNAGNMTNYSGLSFSQNSSITSTHAITNRCVIIGSDGATIESAQTCGVYSSFGGDIKAYTGIGAIRCINSFLIGGVSNELNPNGLANHQNVNIIGGSGNSVFGGTGNAQNSGIINSTNSDITPLGVGSRITVIGLNGFSATRSATTYVDNLDIRGGRVVKTNELNGNTLLTDNDYAIGVIILAGAITLTLPLNPVDGQEFCIENPDGTCNAIFSVTIDGNGKLINGAATQIMTSSYFSVILRYYDGTGKWSMK
jgi:hypothetical protein